MISNLVTESDLKGLNRGRWYHVNFSYYLKFPVESCMFLQLSPNLQPCADAKNVQGTGPRTGPWK